MATPAWPSSLPQKFNADGFQMGMGDGRLRSETDTGPGKMRQRFSAVMKPMSGQMMMDDDQLVAFRDFLDDDLEGGTLAFTFPRQLTDSSSPSTDLLVTLADDMPSWTSAAPGWWSVSLTLNVMP